MQDANCGPRSRMNFRGMPMESEDIAMVNFCNTIRIDLVHCWHYVDVFSIMVHKCCNCVETFDVGQSHDEVLADYLPQAFWYIVGCWPNVLVYACLVTLASVATRNVLRHKACNAWPLIMA
jgi:hypothetical protein